MTYLSTVQRDFCNPGFFIRFKTSSTRIFAVVSWLYPTLSLWRTDTMALWKLMATASFLNPLLPSDFLSETAGDCTDLDWDPINSSSSVKVENSLTNIFLLCSYTIFSKSRSRVTVSTSSSKLSLSMAGGDKSGSIAVSKWKIWRYLQSQNACNEEGVYVWDFHDGSEWHWVDFLKFDIPIFFE